MRDILHAPALVVLVFTVVIWVVLLTTKEDK